MPGVWENVSQIEGDRPSSEAAPSIWYAAVAAPQRKPGGKATAPGAAGAAWLMGGHPLTAPCMIPATNCRPVATNRTSSGIVASAVPASTRA